MSATEAIRAPGDRARQIDVRFMGATVRIDNQVVWRTFPAETIVLDLRSGTYFGLNHTAGRMLEVLGEVGRVRAAADRLAREYGESPSKIQRGLCAFCEDLLERGLIELAEPLG